VSRFRPTVCLCPLRYSTVSTMKRARDKFVDQFFDLEARVGDRDEEEDEDDVDDGTSAQF
jgi:hypothetical protein